MRRMRRDPRRYAGITIGCEARLRFPMVPTRQVRHCDVLNELISLLGTIVVLGKDVEDEGGSGDWTRCIKGDGANSSGTNVHLVEALSSPYPD